MALPNTIANELEPIDDIKIIERYLKYTIDLKEPIQCLVKETNIRFETTPKAIKANQITLKSPLTLAAQEQLLKDINETTHRKINLSFKVQDTLYFIVCDVVSVQEDQLIVQALAPLYKLQRRGSLRFKPDKKLNCKASFPKHLFHEQLNELEVFDLSTGGFSFAIPMEGAQWFEPSHAYETEFQFEGNTYFLNTKMANQKPHKKNNMPCLRVGLQFTNLPSQLEQSIAKHAYSYTQKIFSKRI